MSSPSSPMQVATSVLKPPARKSASTAFCSFWVMPAPLDAGPSDAPPLAAAPPLALLPLLPWACLPWPMKARAVMAGASRPRTARISATESRRFVKTMAREGSPARVDGGFGMF